MYSNRKSSEEKTMGRSKPRFTFRPLDFAPGEVAYWQTGGFGVTQSWPNKVDCSGLLWRSFECCGFEKSSELGSIPSFPNHSDTFGCQRGFLASIWSGKTEHLGVES